MADVAEPTLLPDVEQADQTKPKETGETGYLVICWNDPVNLMDYVTHVFHNNGKSVLIRESLEKAEHYVHQLQKYSLHATLERD